MVAGAGEPRPDPSDADGLAADLAKQSLRFLYRILFLLYAEASPELGVLPVGAPEYDEGYSLDRLRELVLVELTSDAAPQTGTHLYESLGVLFRLVDDGHPPETLGPDGAATSRRRRRRAARSTRCAPTCSRPRPPR